MKKSDKDCKKKKLVEYEIFSRGKNGEIKIYAPKNHPLNESIITVYDIGSNSITAAAYNAAISPPVKLAEHAEKCGLGIGMTDENQILNPEGIKIFNDKFLPAWRKKLKAKDITPQACIIICTAAVRVAKNQQEFITTLAEKLEIPREAITLVSEKTEACIAGHALQLSNSEGYGIMSGGKSLEFVEVRNGKIENWATLPFGIGSLIAMSPEQRTDCIANGLNSIKWLPDRRREKTNAMREGTITLVGGDFRANARRLLGPYNVGSENKVGNYGYIVEAGEAFNLRQTALTKPTYEELERAVLGGTKQEILAQPMLKIGGEDYVTVKFPRKIKALFKKEDYLEEHQKWHEKTGTRVPGLPCVVGLLHACDARLRPQFFHYSHIDMRQATLHTAGLY